jgi:AraC-like DNA-binding protein
MREAEHRLGDPLVGLHAGERARPRGVLAYLVLSCPRLEWALRRCVRFCHIAEDAVQFALQRRRRMAYVIVDHDLARTGRSRHVVDYGMGCMLRALRPAVGPQAGTVVYLRRPARGDAAEFERSFGCPVGFDRTVNALVFPARLLSRPSRFATPHAAERIEDLAIALETRVTRATEQAKVADVVRTMTISGVRVDRTRVARRLGMSPRTLQRALAREGVTFKEVRDDILWDGVHGLLANPECSVQAVAMQACFADSAAFSKAFRRRMGCSPSGYRKRLAG